MNWLFVTSAPWPMHHGTALRVFHLARELTVAGEKVTLLTDWVGEGAKETYQEIGVTFEKIDRGSSVSTLQDIYPAKLHFANTLKEIEGTYDVVVLFAAEMLHLTKYCNGFNCVVADVIDDPVLAAWRRLKCPSSLRWAIRNIRLLWDLRFYERRYLSNVDLFTFVTDADAQSFRRRNKTEQIVAIPNGVSLDGWQVGPINTEHPYVVFVGNYKFVPNRTAVEFLVQKIAPLVWLRNPDVRFCLVGSNPPEWLSGHTDTRIEATGFVDDVRPYVSNARAVVIPMVTGTGIKNKLLEAWAARKPVVATPLACQGIPAIDGKNILVGKNADEIASAICRVWTDDNLSERLANKGNETVINEFAWHKMANKLRSQVLRMISNEGLV